MLTIVDFIEQESNKPKPVKSIMIDGVCRGKIVDINSTSKRYHAQITVRLSELFNSILLQGFGDTCEEAVADALEIGLADSVIFDREVNKLASAFKSSQEAND